MSLLVVLPFFYGDEHLLLKNLAWMKELDGKLDYDCLLACDGQTNPETGRDEARQIFRSVKTLQYKRPRITHWPFCQNHAFLSAAWHVAANHKGPWFWCETDSIPTRRGWLDTLWADYQKGGKPFGGHWNHATSVFNGVAIYPQNIARYSQKMMMAGLVDTKDAAGKPYQPPWDFYGSKEVRPHLHVMNELMQHIWQNDATGEAWTFPDKATVEQVIRPGVVLFHRCKNESLVSRLREAHGATTQNATTADVISLRRNGDIISILPLLKRTADKMGRPVKLAVMREYGPLLEGASYVEPVLCDGDMEDPLLAASRLNAVNAQVFGRGLRPPTRAGNFVKQAWLMLGHKWDRYAPLVFDKRDRKREEELTAKAFKTEKPKVLVKLSGISSPFPYFKEVLGRLIDELLMQEVASAEIVNLDMVKAERLYDLLGLMDRAACCVTIDTATIHLAPATPCPMIEFVHDTNFGESPRKGNCLLRMPYAQVMGCMNEVVEVVKRCIAPKDTGTDMVAVFSNYAAHGAALQREGRARLTWPLLNARLHPFTPKRSSAQLGDKRAMPFVREMIHEAFSTGSENICVICNNDIQIGDGLREAIVKSCMEAECFWSYRTAGPGVETDQGADLFAFTRRWWGLHAPLFPDLLHGYRWWDNILIRLMLWSGCREQARLYYHEPHGDDHRARLQTPGAKWNERLADQWLDMYEEKDQRP